MTTPSHHSSSDPPSLQEMSEAYAKWWKERVDAAQELQGWGGRDLRDQDTLLSTIVGMEQDITFLLRCVNTLTQHVAALATQSQKEES